MTKSIALGSIVTVSQVVGYDELAGQSGKLVGYIDDLALVQFSADVDGHNGFNLPTRRQLLKGYTPETATHWYVQPCNMTLVAKQPKEPSAPMQRAVLDLLRRKGAITSMEAQGVLRCRQLPARVLELKRLGHDIVTEMKLDHTGQKYARYHLQLAA